MDLKQIYITLADYNRWANERVYQACEQLETDAYYQNRSAFFGSIHGTLNHILLADRIWMARFNGVTYSFNSLNDEVYSSLPELRQARQTEDDCIIIFIQSLPIEAIVSNISIHQFQRQSLPSTPLASTHPLL